MEAGNFSARFMGIAPTAARSPEVESGLRVLVADDNELIRRTMRCVLENAGCRVTLVGNGREACATVEATAYDCIFMDQEMPVMTGTRAALWIRAWEATGAGPLHRRLFIVAFTSDDRFREPKVHEAAGMDAFLGKPAQPWELKELLERALAASRAQAGIAAA